MPSCQSTYKNPCPTFDPKDDKDGKNPDEKGQKIFQKAKSAMIEFNECDNPRLCQCNVETELVKNKAVVAGEQTILSLGELVFTNTGTEPSIKNFLDITFDSTIPPCISLLIRTAGDVTIMVTLIQKSPVVFPQLTDPEQFLLSWS